MKIFCTNFIAEIEYMTAPNKVSKGSEESPHKLALAKIVRLPMNLMCGMTESPDINSIAELEVGDRVVVWVANIEEANIPQDKLFTSEADYITEKGSEIHFLKIDNILDVISKDTELKKPKISTHLNLLK